MGRFQFIRVLALSSALFAVVPPSVLSASLQSLAVYPPDVQINTARGRQTVVVQAAFADGITRDVTADAKLTLTNPALAKIAGSV